MIIPRFLQSENADMILSWPLALVSPVQWRRPGEAAAHGLPAPERNRAHRIPEFRSVHAESSTQDSFLCHRLHQPALSCCNSEGRWGGNDERASHAIPAQSE